MTSKRTQELAAKYAAKGKVSANESNRLREEARTGDGMDAMRTAIAAPRTQESRDRAARHKSSLPPLG